VAKKKAQDTSESTPQRTGRVNASIDSVENGYIVRTSSEGQSPHGSYESKTFVAPNHNAALRIASAHIQSCGLKTKGKKTKAGKSKNRMTKR
jgi:hypothetical protein